MVVTFCVHLIPQDVVQDPRFLCWWLDMLVCSLTERFAMRLDPGSWKIYMVQIGHVDHVEETHSN